MLEGRPDLRTLEYSRLTRGQQDFEFNSCRQERTRVDAVKMITGGFTFNRYLSR